jgi:hypothetical protein
MLQVEILDNDKGGHEDLTVTVDGLISKVFDTYYFVIAVEPEDLQDMKNAVAKLLMYWKEQIQSVTDGQKLHLPIDFSDQYSGCIEVAQEREYLHLRYGYTEREGWNINPIDPGDYSKTVSDFEDTENITLEVSKADFIKAIERQIIKLTDVS